MHLSRLGQDCENLPEGKRKKGRKILLIVLLGVLNSPSERDRFVVVRLLFVTNNYLAL